MTYVPPRKRDSRKYRKWEESVGKTPADFRATGTITGAAFATTGAAGIDATISIAPVAPATVAGSATFIKGILTAYTPPS